MLQGEQEADMAIPEGALVTALIANTICSKQNMSGCRSTIGKQADRR